MKIGDLRITFDARATRDAWHKAVNAARATRSLVLSAPLEEREDRLFGTPDLLLRFRFEVS